MHKAKSVRGLHRGTMTVYAPPKKPWEIDGSPAETFIASNIPPSPDTQYEAAKIPDHQPMTSYSQPGYSGFAAPSMGYSAPGYGSYGYSGYNNNIGYAGSMNRPIFGPSVPILSSLESGTNTVFDQLRHLVQAVTSIAQFLDSTVYAGWSSMNALGMVADNLRQLRHLVAGRILGVIKQALSFISVHLLRRKVSNNGGTTLFMIAMIVPALIGILAKLRGLAVHEAIAAHEYISSDPGHLSLFPGQKIKILVREGDWIFAETHEGKRGCVPSSHVEILIKP